MRENSLASQKVTSSELSRKRVLIVGNPGTVHVGHHLHWAGQQLGLEIALIDVRTASAGSFVSRQVNWRLRGHRPARLMAFSEEVLKSCLAYQPDTVIVTGISPPNARALMALSSSGIRCVNFLTDDPWNPAHRGNWSLDALPLYDTIYSPRRSNLKDLEDLGCHAVYLPFAYSPEIHFPETPPPDRVNEFACDVMFYGGADRDRIPYIEALIEVGLNVHLYGGYWDRYRQTRHVARGMADPQRLRWAVSEAKVSLCLVRRANRDGHVMRTFEIPAMGGCMLAEVTEEHEAALGVDQAHHFLFRSISEMVDKAKALLARPQQRETLVAELKQHVVSGANTYGCRLSKMLEVTRKPFEGYQGGRHAQFESNQSSAPSSVI